MKKVIYSSVILTFFHLGSAFASEPERCADALAGRLIERIEESLSSLETQFDELKRVLARTAPHEENGRIFSPISLKELESKIEALDAFEKRFPDLTPQVKEDLSRVSYFDLGVVDYDFEQGELRGYHQLENELTFLGVRASLVDSCKIFFIIYWDGEKLRGYIPEHGNTYNTDTNTAYGDDLAADADNLRRRYPVKFRGFSDSQLEDVSWDWRLQPDISWDEILKDIQAAITPK